MSRKQKAKVYLGQARPSKKQRLKGQQDNAESETMLLIIIISMIIFAIIGVYILSKYF